jgi:hypothetical protein
MITAKYESAFRALTSDMVHCVVEALVTTHPDLAELGDFETGDEVLDYCRASHVSQAEVIMALRNDSRPSAVLAVETIMMRPIDRRSPRQVEQERDAARPRPQVVAPVRANEVQTDTRVIRLLVTSNPKRSGTSAHDRFAKYRDGMTVADALRVGVTRGDLSWDQERGFVRIEAAA